MMRFRWHDINCASFTYDSLDRLSTQTDATGYVTQYVYDAASQKLQEQRAVGTSLQENYATFTYTANGKLATEKDANGNTTSLAYDGFDRLITTTFPDGTTEQVQYDPQSNVTILTNRSGLGLVRCYDALNRKISEQSVSGATNAGSCPTGGTPNQNSLWYDFYNRSFSYDLTSALTTASSTAGWSRSFSYDNAGRVTTLADNFGTWSYGHDANGNLVSISYPTGHVVAYAYDALDRMTSATLDGTTVGTLAWDPLSRRTSTTYGDNSSASYGYDGASQLFGTGIVSPDPPSGLWRGDPGDFLDMTVEVEVNDRTTVRRAA